MVFVVMKIDVHLLFHVKSRQDLSEKNVSTSKNE